MRTTLTIDDDLASILYRESRQKGLSFKELVNATLRRGLSQEQVTPPLSNVMTRPHAFGFKPGIDLDKLNQLADELEAEAFSAKHQAQR
jgi:hypothetical protein